LHREYRGRPDSHPFELLLALEEIEHRTTKIRTPRTNGFGERMNRTLLDDCFRVTRRTTWYREALTIEELPGFVPADETATTPQARASAGRGRRPS